MASSRKSSSPQKRPAARKSGSPPPSRAAPSRYRPALVGLVVLVVAAAGAAGWHFVQKNNEAAAAKAAENAFEQVSAANVAVQKELDAYVSCITGTTNAARTPAEFQKRLAQANGGKYASLGVHIKADCSSAFRTAIGGLRSQFTPIDKTASAWTAFDQAAQALADRADDYAGKLAAHSQEDQVDQSMVDAARKWSQDGASDDDAPRFESFLACAVPDPKVRTDKDALSHWAAAQCAGETPAYSAFMEHLRSECAPRLHTGEPRPSNEEHAALTTVRTTRVLNNTMNIPLFMLMACTEHARRQWVGADGSAFVHAFGDATAKRQVLDRAVTALKPKVTSAT